MAKKDRVYRGSLGAERVSQRREQLVAAGLERFGTDGYEEVSVRAVCAEAGLTERYFYESFANKEELLGAVYLFAISQLNEKVQAAIIEEGPIEPRTRAPLTAYFTFMKQHPAAARVILFEVLGVSGEIDGLYREVMAQFSAEIGQRLQLGPAALVSSGLVGAAVHIAMQWVLGGSQQPTRSVVDACVRIFVAVAK
jgi:AcrR family transcriptional regulator